MTIAAVTPAAMTTLMLRIMSMSVPMSQLIDSVMAIIPAAIAAIYREWRGVQKLREGTLIVI